MSATTLLFAKTPIVPVISLDRVEDAAPLAEALLCGGLLCAEITLRTPAALEVLREFTRRQDLLVGAGSVRTRAQVDAVVDAGACFVVSPGFSDGVVERCGSLGVPSLPGVATPTEIMQALDAGLDVVKLFPAGVLGGPSAIRALSAPFPGLQFVPTGGIGASDLVPYLSLDAVLAIGGSWMVSSTLVREGRFDEITRLSREAVAMAAQVRP